MSPEVGTEGEIKLRCMTVLQLLPEADLPMFTKREILAVVEFILYGEG